MADNALTLALELLEKGKDVSLTVKGNSMYPFLISGRDKVILKKTTPLSRGDIVLYKCRNNSYALHRIDAIDKDGNFKIIGDGQLVADYPVLPDTVIAKVVSVERKGKVFSNKSIKWKLFSNRLFLKLSKQLLVKKAIKKGSDKRD